MSDVIVYYINLNKDTERRKNISEELSKNNINAKRFAAIDGRKRYKNQHAKGSRACRDSHLAVWNLALKNDITLILEDDIFIKPGLINYIQKVIKTIEKSQWEVIYFGYNTIAGDRYNEELIKLNSGTVASGFCYIVNRNTVQNIIGVFKDSNHIYWDVALKNDNKIRLFASKKQLVHHNWSMERIRKIIDRI